MQWMLSETIYDNIKFYINYAEQMKIDGLDVILEQCECQISACYPRSNADDLFDFGECFFFSLFFVIEFAFCDCVCVSVCECRIAEYLLYASNENDNDNGNNTG